MTTRIPAAQALIGWNTNKAGRVTEVFVIPDGRDSDWTRSGVPRRWHEADYTWGACFKDWLQGGHDMTPEYVFSEIAVAYGCADSQVMEQAIAEFAKIEECAWARAMVPPSPSSKTFWTAK